MKSNFKQLAKQVERDLGLELVRNRHAYAATPRDDEGRLLTYTISHGLSALVRSDLNFRSLAEVARYLEQEEIKRS